jgi:hypothetical protein
MADRLNAATVCILHSVSFGGVPPPPYLSTKVFKIKGLSLDFGPDPA